MPGGLMGLFDAIKKSLSTSSELANYWHVPEDPSRLSEIADQSYKRPQLIYKHSHRCGTCFFAKNQVEEAADQIREEADLHFVDVIGSRAVSNRITDKWGVRHESPQLLLLKDGEVVWHASHGAIKSRVILKVLDDES
ncbi:MAG TPA: bacillithiol system redox-active protein YtxJ [Fodinibius sp.]|nr:bacillithiol system redox-active protein YtxJ [Fodinibius sp.]